MENIIVIVIVAVVAIAVVVSYICSLSGKIPTCPGCDCCKDRSCEKEVL
ncbi:MAG: hypothetical protein KAS23_05930 [Anaerohalosphaera sp.]|nr:hypothetical protein [Anaerohalosphaera sp.]